MKDPARVENPEVTGSIDRDPFQLAGERAFRRGRAVELAFFAPGFFQLAFRAELRDDFPGEMRAHLSNRHLATGTGRGKTRRVTAEQRHRLFRQRPPERDLQSRGPPTVEFTNAHVTREPRKPFERLLSDFRGFTIISTSVRTPVFTDELNFTGRVPFKSQGVRATTRTDFH